VNKNQNKKCSLFSDIDTLLGNLAKKMPPDEDKFISFVIVFLNMDRSEIPHEQDDTEKYSRVCYKLLTTWKNVKSPLNTTQHLLQCLESARRDGLRVKDAIKTIQQSVDS